MGGVRTGVGGGSRGKLGVQRRTVQVTAVVVPTCRCVDASSPWGEGKGLCAKGAWDTEQMWLGGVCSRIPTPYLLFFCAS